MSNKSLYERYHISLQKGYMCTQRFHFIWWGIRSFIKKTITFKEILIVCRSEEDAIKLENSGFNVESKTKNEITLKVENNLITSSLKTILNNFDIEDLYINEPPIDEIIGRILIKKRIWKLIWFTAKYTLY